jgi:hypothetical protein
MCNNRPMSAPQARLNPPRGERVAGKTVSQELDPPDGRHSR